MTNRAFCIYYVTLLSNFTYLTSQLENKYLHIRLSLKQDSSLWSNIQPVATKVTVCLPLSDS
jgi:hypothetical protein